ncbi:MAG: rhodanese-like domain-containing protein [Bacteroidetes bacterium]|nr:rhodanese-like domain-containing protein [Bacteroidota bacterium]
MNNQSQVDFYNNKLAYEIDSSDLFEAINKNELIMVIDARKPEAFVKEHIPLANNFPHREMNEETTKRLSKDVLYVTYCDGIGCNASTKGALKLTQLGFKVKELLGGLDWWKRDGYATQGTNEQNGQKLNCAC